MAKKSDNAIPVDLDPTGLEDETVSTNQEAVPVPMVIGERKVAVRWISKPVPTRSEYAGDEDQKK